jgi:hypothetical protein
MRRILACLLALAAIGALLAPACAVPSGADEFTALPAVQKWIFEYRRKPEPGRLPAVVQALSRLQAFREPDNAGIYIGFIAGVIAANPAKADALVGRMFPLPPEDHWAVIRAIAYSALPGWKGLLIRYADRMPGRKVMIDKLVAGDLPVLSDVRIEEKPAFLDNVKSYLTVSRYFGPKEPARRKLTFDGSPELLDVLWGYYFATGASQPIARIIALLPWSKDKDSTDKLTVGNMAKYTLATNGSRDADILALMKSELPRQPEEVKPILTEVIDNAETVETSQLRKEALAAIEDLKRKGPGSKREMSLIGQIGQGAVYVGCVAAAALGQVEVGIPCVIGGAAGSAALSIFNGQQ